MTTATPRRFPPCLAPCDGRFPQNNTTAFSTTLINHHLTIATRYRPHGPTFYGPAWNSRIDHIAIPITAFPRMRTAYVDHTVGDKSQLIVPKTRTNISIAGRSPPHSPSSSNSLFPTMVLQPPYTTSAGTPTASSPPCDLASHAAHSLQNLKHGSRRYDPTKTAYQTNTTTA